MAEGGRAAVKRGPRSGDPRLSCGEGGILAFAQAAFGAISRTGSHRAFARDPRERRRMAVRQGFEPWVGL